MLQRHFSILLLAVSAILPATANADLLEEVIVTATRSDQAVSSIVSNISIIDDETLQKIRHTHLNEALQRVSGVWISRGNGQESLTAIRSPVLTGAGGCAAFLMVQDGIPLQASGFCNVNELFGAQSENAGRIEVIKGPGSALHGSNALHGVINVLTPGIDSTESSNGELEAGPHQYGRVKLSHSNNKWRIDVSGTSDGGYKDASGFDQQKLIFKASGRTGPFHSVTTISATNLNQETAGFVQGTAAYKVSGRKRENPNPEAYRDVKTLRGQISLQRETVGGHLSLTPYFRTIDMAFLQHFLPGHALEENGHTSFGIQSSWHSDAWTIGVDAEQTSGFLEESQASPTSGSAFLMATIPAGRHYDYEVDAITSALFAQYTVDISDDTQVVLGARFEVLAYDYENQMIAGPTRDDGSECGFGGCRFSRPEDRSDTFRNFSPKLGLTHMLASGLQVYIQLAQGFRAPQATELYRLQANQSVSNIDSEDLASLEVGVRGGDERFSFDISTFAMRKDNFIFRDTNRMNVDIGETDHRGIEITLSRHFSDNISANLHLSYARHQYANNPALVSSPVKGNDVDTAPRRFGSFNIHWTPSAALALEAEWIHMGDYFTDPQNTASYEGHDLVNVRVEYSPSKSWGIFMKIMNASDTDYAERADFGFGNDRYFIGEPRSVHVGITFRRSD